MIDAGVTGAILGLAFEWLPFVFEVEGSRSDWGGGAAELGGAGGGIERSTGEGVLLACWSLECPDPTRLPARDRVVARAAGVPLGVRRDVEVVVVVVVGLTTGDKTRFREVGSSALECLFVARVRTGGL
jgi:hypothetical protein